MSIRRSILLSAVVAVLALAAPAASAATQAAKPMTNDDVVTMVKLGLGDEVVIAKIQTAALVDFKTEIADLETLKKEGVSQSVIAAMVKRQGTAQPPDATKPSSSSSSSSGKDSKQDNPQQQPQNYPPMPSGFPGMPGMPSSDVSSVVLATKDKGEIPVPSMHGQFDQKTGMMSATMSYRFTGSSADARTKDHRPVLLVKSSQNPDGRLWLVVVAPDKPDHARRVKMGSTGAFHQNQNAMSTPDKGTRIEYSATKEGDVWRLTPSRDLPAGEYGVFFSGMMMSAELWGFGVD